LIAKFKIVVHNVKRKVKKTLVFILIVIPLAAMAQWNPYGMLKAEVYGNSVVLKNDSVYRNCACWYSMEVVQLEGDTLAWYEWEQSTTYAYCECHFNLSVTMDSLNPGNYFVKTYFTDVPYPDGDTIYIGLISFTIAEQNSFNSYSFSNGFQSNCYNWFTGVGNQNIIRRLSVYPIPATDKLIISTLALENNTLLSIFNVNGEKLIERQLQENETQIIISALPSGVYFLRLQSEKLVEEGIMIKE